MILDLCGGTGAWSQPYKDDGYDVRLVTLPEQDVREYVFFDHLQVHGILAAPPCTEFAGSGARWWAEKDPRLLKEALEVFDACLRIVHQANPRWWALENPIGRLRRLRKRELGEPLLVFDPCDYGDPYTKRTQLWGNFQIPEKRPVEPILGSRMHRMSSSWRKQRSITPEGFALAFFQANP